MKNLPKFILTAFFLFFVESGLLFSQASALEHVGMVKKLTGNVKVQRGDVSMAARLGMELMDKDLLITEEKGSAGVIFTDGTTIAIGPGTEFKIKGYRFKPDINAYDFSMYLKQGSALYTSGKIGKLSPEATKISTPRATVGVRGTRFIVNVQ